MQENLKRKDNISWDEYFMTISKLAALRSKDPSTQVGACIVSMDNRILSIGYNGTPIGFDDDIFPWSRDKDALESKYLYVVHAERNAVLNYKGCLSDFKNSKLYVSLFPCNECAKELVQLGIKEVIYIEDKYHDTNEVKASKRIFDECNVKYRKLDNIKNESITINLTEMK